MPSARGRLAAVLDLRRRVVDLIARLRPDPGSELDAALWRAWTRLHDECSWRKYPRGPHHAESS